MKQDNLGQVILDEQDLCDLYMRDPGRKLLRSLTTQSISFDPDLELIDVPELVQYLKEPTDQSDFDSRMQTNWHMPEEYKNLDIASWVLSQCQTDAELQRVGHELMLFQERGMFDLLRFLKYMIDTLRVNNIIWGVGRGSSVASYVLYLIGVHRINSMYYDLDIQEFLR